jgi:molybdopterin-binding protein
MGPDLHVMRVAQTFVGRTGYGRSALREDPMETSARNQLKGTVVSVSLGTVMAEVTVDVNGAQVVAAITKESAERLGLAEGKSVVVIVKATDVMIGIALV